MTLSCQSSIRNRTCRRHNAVFTGLRLRWMDENQSNEANYMSDQRDLLPSVLDVESACRRLREHDDGDASYFIPVPGCPSRFFTSDDDIRTVLQYAECARDFRATIGDLQRCIADWKHATQCQTPEDAKCNAEAIGQLNELLESHKAKLIERLSEIRRNWEHGVDIEQGTWRTQMKRLICDDMMTQAASVRRGKP
jgi:hypothetical protein